MPLLSQKLTSPDTQALNLLLNILGSGTVSSGPVSIPSPPHLAVAATFLVHPSTTTRAKTAEEKEAPSAALRLLRLVNTLVGPATAKFDLAFTFTHFETSRRGNRRRRRDDDHVSDTENSTSRDETKPLNLELGQSGAVWSRAEDFWHAVGWAFNCSVLHPWRWERWRLWLEFMCEVLEDDWNERKRRIEAKEVDSEQDGEEQILEQSLIYRYIQGGSAGQGRNRRILRAIFADGAGNSANEFREIFHNELKQLKKNPENVKKREAEVNIDKEEYGDYLTKDDDDGDDDDDQETVTTMNEDGSTDKPEAPRPKRSRRGRPARNNTEKPSTPTTQTTSNSLSIHGGLTLLGGLSSLSLRQRLLHLLSSVSEALPDSFVCLEDLYHLFVENIRHLPLPIYQAFLSPSTLPYFSAEAQTTLCECLLFRLRESGAPETDEEYLSQNKLEQCFLPFAASSASVADNVRMSIALETLLTLLAESDLLRLTTDLLDAAQEGIEVRADRALDEIRRNKASRQTEDIEWCWLIESGERMMFLLNEVFPLVLPTS